MPSRRFDQIASRPAFPVIVIGAIIGSGAVAVKLYPLPYFLQIISKYSIIWYVVDQHIKTSCQADNGIARGGGVAGRRQVYSPSGGGLCRYSRKSALLKTP